MTTTRRKANPTAANHQQEHPMNATRTTDKMGAHIYDERGSTLATAPNATTRSRSWYQGKPLPKDTLAILQADDFEAACLKYGWRAFTDEDRANEDR